MQASQGSDGVELPDVERRSIARRSMEKRDSGIAAALRKIARKALALKRKNFYPHTDARGKLPLWKRLAYGGPAFATTSLTMLIAIHGTLFFTRLGAPVAFLGFFTALARTFDVLTDPICGYISDSTNPESGLVKGRRRPYMLIGCWFYSLLFCLLFSPPDDVDTTGLLLWFGVWYIVLYWADTIANVPYGALGPELTDDPDERNQLFFVYGIFKGVGILTAAVAPVMFTLYFEDNPNAAPFHDVDCACGDTYKPNPNTSATGWNAQRYGTFPNDYYEFDLLCDQDDCTDYDKCIDYNNYPDSTCNIMYNNTARTCDKQLTHWCSDYFDCDNDCQEGASRAGMTAVAMFFGGYYIISMLICVFFITERKLDADAPKDPPLIPSVMRTTRNKPFMGLLPAWVCDMTAFTMIGTMLPFYVTYVVRPDQDKECEDGKRCPTIWPCDNDECCSEDEQDTGWCDTDIWLGLGLVFLMTATIVSTPVWLWATKRFGKNKTWLTFNLTTALTNGLFVFVGEGNPKLAIFLAFVNGLPNGASFLTDSIVADVIDYDEFLTGTRSEGRFTIFQTFIPKIVSIPAQAVPLGLLATFGFKPPKDGVPQDQPSNVRVFVSFLFFVLPCVLAIVSYLLKLRFPIKKEQQMEDIATGVALHMKNKPARDPLTGRLNYLFRVKDQEEEELTWDFDCFDLVQLKFLAANGPVKLEQQMLWKCYRGSALSLFFLVLTVWTAAAGVLSSARFAWIPSLAVISFGLCSCALGINYYRLRVSRNMQYNPNSEHGQKAQALLDRWVVYQSGTDYIRNREEMLRISDILSRVEDALREEIRPFIREDVPEERWLRLVNANHFEQYPEVEQQLPDISGPAGILSFHDAESDLADLTAGTSFDVGDEEMDGDVLDHDDAGDDGNAGVEPFATVSAADMEASGRDSSGSESGVPADQSDGSGDTTPLKPTGTAEEQKG